MKSRTFILADNQDITRLGLENLTRQYSLAVSVYTAACKKELVELLRTYPGSVIIIDYTLFDFTRYEELLNIRERFPETSWLLFSEELSEDFLKRIYPAKAFGILFKSAPQKEITEAIEETCKGNVYNGHYLRDLHAGGNQEQNEGHPGLTQTETEILKLIASGKTVKEIAALRISSTHTITTHKKNIFRKLGVNTVYEATRYAMRAGLADRIEYYI